MVIVFDLDEVVFNYTDPFLAWVNEQRGTRFTRADVHSYSYEDSGIIPKESNKDWVDAFAAEGNLRILPLMPDAATVIHRLYRKHEIIYLTSRDEKWREDTEYALAANDLWSPVYFSTKEKNKGMWVKELKAHRLVDDNPLFIKEVAEHSTAKPIIFTKIPECVAAAAGYFAEHASDWMELEQIIESRYRYVK